MSTLEFNIDLTIVELKRIFTRFSQLEKPTKEDIRIRNKIDYIIENLEGEVEEDE